MLQSDNQSLDKASYDAVIVGAGPAGMACAIGLALRQKKVLVIDSGRMPQDKACGEAIMPDGLALLEELGICTRDLGGVPLLGIHYIDRGQSLRLDWPHRPALGLRRTLLSAALWQRAQELGVVRLARRATKIEDGERVARVWLGPQLLLTKLVIGADGLHSVVRQALCCDGRKKSSNLIRMGVRQHFDVAPWSQHVEIYLADGMEAYVTPIGPKTVGVATLGPKATGDLLEALAPFSALVQRLKDAPTTSMKRGAGPLYQRCERITGSRVALVGDASGYLDALTGEGITLALGQAALLCRVIDENRNLTTYARGHKKITFRYRLSVTSLLWLGSYPKIRSAVLFVARLCPYVAASLASWVTNIPPQTKLRKEATKRFCNLD